MLNHPSRPTQRRREAPLVLCVSCLKRYRRYLKKGETKYVCDACRQVDLPPQEKRELPVPYNTFPPGY